MFKCLFCFNFTNQDKCSQMANTMNISDRWVSALTSVRKKQVRDACELAGPDETHPGILNEVAKAVTAASRWHRGWVIFQKRARDNHNHVF